MQTVQIAPLPPGALLEGYAKGDAYTDCYVVELAHPASLEEFVVAFYTTPLFKLERWILSKMLGFTSTDNGARELAQGKVEVFSAWRVEARESGQIVLAAGRTRSWLMATPQSDTPAAGARLFFGSAVVPRKRGGFGWQFSTLLGFHKLYSRALLAAAARRLAKHKS